MNPSADHLKIAMAAIPRISPNSPASCGIYTSPVTRRTFLLGGAALAASTFFPIRTKGAPSPFSAYPFTLGVASGDPAPDGFVLWTRLAPRPLEPDGGMTPAPVEVVWEVADDEGMTRIVRHGTATASPEWAHSVHVEVEGLQPDRWFWYRFKAGGEVSSMGRARTLPAAGTMPERLRFAFASCQKYEVGFFTAYEHLVREAELEPTAWSRALYLPPLRQLTGWREGFEQVGSRLWPGVAGVIRFGSNA